MRHTTSLAFVTQRDHVGSGYFLIRSTNLILSNYRMWQSPACPKPSTIISWIKAISTQKYVVVSKHSLVLNLADDARNSYPFGIADRHNIYAYVGGNPINFVDVYGLTREDIDRLTGLVRDTQPDLNVPTPGSIGTAPLIGNGSAITNPLTLGVTVDNYYLSELNYQQRQMLLETIIHESIHRTKPRSDMLRRPFNHPDIYKEAERRRREIDSRLCY